MVLHTVNARSMPPITFILTESNYMVLIVDITPIHMKGKFYHFKGQYSHLYEDNSYGR